VVVGQLNAVHASLVDLVTPPVEPAEPDAPEESVNTWFDAGGRFGLSSELDADHGRVVDAALSAARPAAP
jgi:hypothetical protein